MVFPIINGTKCSSSRPLSGFCLAPSQLGNEEQDLDASFCHHLAVARNSDCSLMATLAITYFPASAWDDESLNDQDGENQKHVEYIYYNQKELDKNHNKKVGMSGVAQIEITLTDLTGKMSPSTSVSLKSQSTTFRLPLVTVSFEENNNQSAAHSPPAANIIFSTDSTQLACLIPHCGACCLLEENETPTLQHTASTLVICALHNTSQSESENEHTSKETLPLPAFLRPQQSSSPLKLRGLPKPCDPRIVSGILPHFELPFTDFKPANKSNTYITSICGTESPILLAGCHDGSIIGIIWKRAHIAGCIYLQCQNQDQIIGIRSLCHSIKQTVTPLAYRSNDNTPAHDGSNGRLAVIYNDGQLRLFSTYIGPHDEEEEHNLSFDAIIEDDGFNILDSSQISLGETSGPTNSPNFTRHLSTTTFESTLYYQDSDNKKPNLQAMMVKLEFLLEFGSQSECTDSYAVTPSNGVNSIHQTPKKQSRIEANMFLEATWIDYTIATTIEITDKISSKFNHEVICCQVWAICNNIEEFDSYPKKKLVSELALNPNRITEEPDALFGRRRNSIHQQSLRASSSIEYDHFSGCLLVGHSIRPPHQANALSRSFFCLWDWRASVIGAVISEIFPSNSLFSHATTAKLGHLLLHTHASLSEISVDTYPVSFLNPSESRVPCTSHASPILISPFKVGFPFLSQASLSYQANISPDATLDWKEVQIPSHYTTSHGGVEVAAIGRKYGRSLAIASERGLCILDMSKSYKAHWGGKKCLSLGSLPCASSSAGIRYEAAKIHCSIKKSNPRWRFFAKEQEENIFKVHCMTWWERDELDDDLLLAVVQIFDDAVNDKLENYDYRLVCWSRRALSKDQLLVESNRHLSAVLPNQSGVILPGGVVPHTLSLLPHVGRDNQATLLISSLGEKANYVVFSLIAQSDVLLSGHPVIVASLIGSGTIPAAESLITSIFVSGTQGDTYESDAEISAKVIITFGVGTLSGSLEAVSIASDFSSISGPILDGESMSRCTPRRLANYWLSDTLCDHGEVSYIWTMHLTHGCFICWKVPSASSNQAETVVESSKNCLPISLRLGYPQPVRPRSILNIHTERQRFLLSALGCVSEVRTLPFGGSLASLSDMISMGPLSYSFDCAVLFLNQRARPLRIQSDSSAGQNLTKGSIFSVANCTIGPPAFTATIMMLLTEESIVPSSEQKTGLMTCRDRIMNHKMDDSQAFCLRNLMMHVLSAWKRNSSILECNMVIKSCIVNLGTLVGLCYSPLQFSEFFLGIARQLEPSLLDILFPLPLSKKFAATELISHLDNQTCMVTIEDLSVASIIAGSLVLAASGLPLFSSQEMAHRATIAILCHCLCVLGQDTEMKNCESCRIEERSILRELLYFGIKVEDALETAEYDSDSAQQSDTKHSAVCKQNGKSAVEYLVANEFDNREATKQYTLFSLNETGPESSINNDIESPTLGETSNRDPSSVSNTGDFTYDSEDSEDELCSQSSDEEENKHTGLLRKVAAQIFGKRMDRKNHVLDTEIAEAAKYFILSGFDEESLFFDVGHSIASAQDNESKASVESVSSNSVDSVFSESKQPIPQIVSYRCLKTIIATYFSHTFYKTYETDAMCTILWKRIAIVSKLLQQEDVEKGIDTYWEGIDQKHVLIAIGFSIFDLPGQESELACRSLTTWFLTSIRECSLILSLRSQSSIYSVVLWLLQSPEIRAISGLLVTRLGLIHLIVGVSSGLLSVNDCAIDPILQNAVQDALKEIFP